MDLKLSHDELSLKQRLASWLASNYSFATHLERTSRPESRDETIWTGLVQNGFIERALPRRGELQRSLADASLVAEEFGRGLVTEPFLRSSFPAAQVIFEVAEESEGDALLDEIRTGTHRFACAFYEPRTRFSLTPAETIAEERGNGWRLTGRKAMVMDGADADRLLVTARLPSGETGLFVMAGDDAAARARFHTIDDFSAADIDFHESSAVLLGSGAAVRAGIERGVDRAITALGAEVIGASSEAIEETARYAGERVQFGQPIAKFQVVAHRLARMFIELEALRGGLFEALANVGGDPNEEALAAAGLKVLMAQNGRFVVNQGIQLHGGVGVMNNYKVSHCFKRVFALETLFGNADYHLDRYARLMN